MKKPTVGLNLTFPQSNSMLCTNFAGFWKGQKFNSNSTATVKNEHVDFSSTPGRHRGLSRNPRGPKCSKRCYGLTCIFTRILGLCFPLFLEKGISLHSRGKVCKKNNFTCILLAKNYLLLAKFSLQFLQAPLSFWEEIAFHP